MNSSFEIIDFYNGGAQVQVPVQTVNMTHTFSGGADTDAEPEEIGYHPRGNSKLAEGAAYDELEHGGQRLLLLKGGHVYAVTVGDQQHVISAEEGHLSLPVPTSADVEVEEYDEEKHGTIEDVDPDLEDEGDDEDAVGDDEDAASDEEE